jgi:hypothetical protein
VFLVPGVLLFRWSRKLIKPKPTATDIPVPASAERPDGQIIENAAACETSTQPSLGPEEGSGSQSQHAWQVTSQSRQTCEQPPASSRPDDTKTISVFDLDMMEGHEFERWLADPFASAAWNVVNVGHGGGDQGADLIIEKAGRRIVVQAKRYDSSVSNSAVQQAYSAIPVYRAQEAWVVTNGSFTPQAVQLASHTGVRLCDRSALGRWIRDPEHFGE